MLLDAVFFSTSCIILIRNQSSAIKRRVFRVKKIFSKNKKEKKQEVIHFQEQKAQRFTDNNEIEEEEFDHFFSEVLKKMPNKTAQVIQNAYGKTRGQAEKVLAKSKGRFDRVFDEFLVDIDRTTKKKCHTIIHAAALSAAIIGCSPIPFSDAFLLVPVQLVMMSRLHKLFGQSWSEGLGKSISKELIIVGFGRSAVGNIMKFVPVVGTVAGSAVNATVAIAITESLGWVTVKMLHDGEDIFEQVMSFKGQTTTLFKMLQKSKK